MLAQANLDRGGNVDEDRRAKTPLPVTEPRNPGRDLADAQRRAQQLEVQQQRAARAGARGAEPRAGRGAAPGADAEEPGGAAERARPRRPVARRDAPAGADRPPDRGIPEAPAQEVHRRARHRVPLRAVRGRLAREGRARRHAQLPGRGARQALRQPAADGDHPRPTAASSRSSSTAPRGSRCSTRPRSGSCAWRRRSPRFPPDIRRDTDLLVITRTWFFGQGDKIWTE